MSPRRAAKNATDVVGFQPDRSRLSRLKGQRRAVLRHLYRTVFLRDNNDSAPKVITMAGGKRLQRLKRRQKQQRMAAILVGIAAGLHMLATMWWNQPSTLTPTSTPPLAEASDQVGVDDLFDCAVIWAMFWFVVTDVLGVKPAVHLYGWITVLSFFFSAPDEDFQAGVSEFHGEEGVEMQQEEMCWLEEVPTFV